MRIDLRDVQRRALGRAAVDPAVRPTRIAAEAEPSRLAVLGMHRASKATLNGPPREVFLIWDSAVDDSGQLRRCIACGCTDLFTEKAFPQVTAVIVVLAFIGAIVGAVGLANTPLLYGMLIILVFDVAILVLSRRRLVCYRCRSAFRDLPIARYHRSWDRAVADRYPAPSRESLSDAAIPAEVKAAPAETVKPSEPSTVDPTTNYFASG